MTVAEVVLLLLLLRAAGAAQYSMSMITCI
jgi:hypothetical protein